MTCYVLDEPLRHAEPPLQRGQIRSPIHALSNVARQLRQMRALRSVSPAPDLRSFVMHPIWALMPRLEVRSVQGSHAPSRYATKSPRFAATPRSGS
jgi:hypothetical protein